MALTLTADQEAALRSGAIAIRALVDFYLDSGRASFWDGDEVFAYEGQNYIPASDFGAISSISMGMDLGAEGMRLTLNGTKLREASPDPLDPGALFGTIEAEAYQQRRVEIRFAFFDAATGALILVVRRYAGLIDQIVQTEEMSEDGSSALLLINLESVVRRYGRRGGRTRSHEDQQEIWAGDEFFKFTSSAIAKQGSLPWGRKPAGTGGASGGGFMGGNAPFIDHVIENLRG